MNTMPSTIFVAFQDNVLSSVNRTVRAFATREEAEQFAREQNESLDHNHRWERVGVVEVPFGR
jgi:hypothetical protein